jgi:hypothetical protein
VVAWTGVVGIAGLRNVGYFIEDEFMMARIEVYFNGDE